VAGTDLTAWFKRAVASTEELDYAEALEWFGLQNTAQRLDALPDASAAQRERLAVWLR
jgi:predicted metalloprotease with PDZ domain